MKNPIPSTITKINNILQKARPYIQMHGGDVSLLSFKKGIVTLQITGACTHCSLADLTYNKMLGTLLKEEVRGVKEVVIEK